MFPNAILLGRCRLAVVLQFYAGRQRSICIQSKRDTLQTPGSRAPCTLPSFTVCSSRVEYFYHTFSTQFSPLTVVWEGDAERRGGEHAAPGACRRSFACILILVAKKIEGDLSSRKNSCTGCTLENACASAFKCVALPPPLSQTREEFAILVISQGLFSFAFVTKFSCSFIIVIFSKSICLSFDK